MKLLIYDHLGSTSCSITTVSVVLACAITALITFPLGLLVGVVFCLIGALKDIPKKAVM